MSGQGRRPAGAPGSTGGQFTEGVRGETDLDLAGAEPSQWESETPVAVDEALAVLYGEQLRLMDRRSSAARNIRHLVAVHLGRFDRGGATLPMEQALDKLRAKIDDPATAAWQRRSGEQSLQVWEETGTALAANRQAQQPMHDEFDRRGGWGRAFLVTGGDGHVHSSMRCSSCNRGENPTEFQWMTQFSGAPESEIVDAAGWRACTVCFPTAPVGTAKTLPTRMFSDDELAKEQARAEREAAKVARNAKKVAAGLTPDGSPLRLDWSEDAPGWDRNPDGSRAHSVRSRPHTESFKTERAATQWLVQEVAWGADWEGPKKPAFDTIVAAIAAKHSRDENDVRAELMDKVAAKIKRDS